MSGLLVGCNLLLGTEPPVLRQPGGGGAGGGAAAATTGAGGGDDVSFADGSGGSESAGGTGGSGTGVCGDGSWAHWPVGGAHEYQIFTGSTLQRSVTDSLTGLDWQGRASTIAVSQSEAELHCKLLKWADKTGWRLPTRMELLSIVDYSKAAPSLDGMLFPDTPSDQFWTSSPSMYLPAPLGSAFWRVSFVDGGASPGMTSSDGGQVRCVRGGAPPLVGGIPSTCYRYDVTETTARDIETGLTWERTGSDHPLSRKDAAARCAATQSTDATWRLPTIAELTSIIDEEKVDAPRLDPMAFPKGVTGQGDWYWSSTSDAVKPGGAVWSVGFVDGTVSELASDGSAYARCVR